MSTEHPVKQKILSVTISNNSNVNGENYTVGVENVTRIEATEKSGQYSHIPYIRIWKGDLAFAEFCQHNIVGIYFEN